LDYCVFTDVTLPSRDIKTCLSLEGSDQNHFELKESLTLSRASICNLKKIGEMAVQNDLAGRVTLIDRKMV
jgi:hypothetical protein